ncbi:hypothetical protein AB0Y20_18800 [Heyndrickxia oleronia]|uniref:hypothetical protein n=1 Tax=Heyndrickxia oleronia TaxID=38875 RepID=UPI003F25DA8B
MGFRICAKQHQIRAKESRTRANGTQIRAKEPRLCKSSSIRAKETKICAKQHQIRAKRIRTRANAHQLRAKRIRTRVNAHQIRSKRIPTPTNPPRTSPQRNREFTQTSPHPQRNPNAQITPFILKENE